MLKLEIFKKFKSARSTREDKLIEEDKDLNIGSNIKILINSKKLEIITITINKIKFFLYFFKKYFIFC